MKKCIAILLLCCSFAFVGCGRDNTQHKIDELTAKIEKLESDAQISQSTIDDLQEQNATQKQQIEDLEEENANQKQQIEEVKEGIFGAAFYSLQEAYDRGWLTQYDLLSIAYYHQGTAGNEDLMDENFIPKPKYPEELSEGTQEIIKFYIWVNTGGYYYGPEDMFVDQYYGTYNGCIAMRKGGPFGGAPEGNPQTVAGVKFTSNHACDTIIIWRPYYNKPIQ